MNIENVLLKDELLLGYTTNLLEVLTEIFMAAKVSKIPRRQTSKYPYTMFKKRV